MRKLRHNYVLWLIAACFTVTLASAQGKFQKTATQTFQKACGSGLDQHSACGVCGTPPVTKGAICGHICVTLPKGKTDKDMNMVPSATEDRTKPFRPCGNPGECDIHWSRFESWEFYPEKNELCGRFKNWNSDREATFRIEVTEK